MTKNERDKGEKILKSWANAKYRINQIQNELNLIKDGFNNDFIQDINKNSEIYSIYKELLFEMLSEMKKKMLDFKCVEDVINKLDNCEKNIIIYRDQKNYSWDKIALVNHTSRSNCFNIKNRIIKEILLHH